MNRIQFNEWKKPAMAEYEGKINKLKKEMEEAVLMFSRMEHTLVDDDNNLAVNTPAGVIRRHKIIKRRERTVTATGTPTVPIRMKAVLEKIQGEFARHTVFDLTNNDGYGANIPRGTMAPVFAGWVKDGTVRVIKEAHGSKGGVYKKAEEVKAQTNSSSAVHEGVVR